jgi:hypothetical protein
MIANRRRGRRKQESRMVRQVSFVAFFAVTIGVAQGCGGMGFTVDKEKLVRTASFDHNCPEAKVRIVNEMDEGMTGTGQYALDVCGAPKKYKRAGTLYYDAEKGGPLGK